MIVAHVAGIPVEEVVPLALTGGATTLVALRALVSRRRGPARDRTG